MSAATHTYREHELVPFDWDSFLNQTDSNASFVSESHTDILDWDDQEYLSDDLPFEALSLDDLMIDDEKKVSTKESIQKIILYSIDGGFEYPQTTYECPICYETFTQDNQVITNCNHVFCSDCIVNHLNSCVERCCSPCCSVCRTDYTLFEIPSKNTLNKLKTELEKYQETPQEESENLHPNVTQRRTTNTGRQYDFTPNDIDNVLED